MRYVTIFLVTLISSCSWSWPWGASKTGNCLDDGNCQGANPFEEKLKGGTWHCYGVSKEEPWDCDQEQDDTKISAIEDAPQRSNSPELMDSAELVDSPQPAVDNEGDTEQNDRAEMDLADTISNSDEISSEKPGMEASNPQVMTAEVLSGYSDTSFAIQLIALQTLEEAIQYTEKLNLDQPIYVKIRSQNSNWHVILLGIYETRSEADAVSEQWTSTHGLSPRPWIRPLHPLKKAANLVAP